MGEAKKEKFWYSVPAHDPATRYEASSIYRTWEFRAEPAAEDYFYGHDGWESKWPLEFHFFESESGPIAAKFTVDLEHNPEFTVHEIEEPEGLKG